MNSEGRLDACELARESDEDAPEGCRVPLRVHLRKVAADAKEKEAKEQATAQNKEGANGAIASRPDAPCPEGKVRAEGGSCVPPSPNIRYQCRPYEVEECKVQCDKGHLGSCERLGALHLYGTPPIAAAKTKVERDPKAAVTLLERACNTKDPTGQATTGCSTLAAAYKQAIYPVTKPGEAYKSPTNDEKKAAFDKAGAVLDFACKRLDHQACYNLAMHHDSGMPPVVSGDTDRAMHFYKRACSLGNQGACSTAARLYVEGKKRPDGSDAFRKDPSQGLAILDKACMQNSTMACNQLATYLTADKYKVKDVKRAAGIFQALCERKNNTGCAEYALLQVNGEGGVKADPQAAREALERLCYDINLSTACYGVALLKETGAAGSTEDRAKALEYYKKYWGTKDSAARAARLLEAGAPGIAKNEQEAGDFYAKACSTSTNSDASLCVKAATIQTKYAPMLVRSHYARACTLGDKGSCAKANAPPPKGPPGPPPPPPSAAAKGPPKP